MVTLSFVISTICMKKKIKAPNSSKWNKCTVNHNLNMREYVWRNLQVRYFEVWIWMYSNAHFHLGERLDWGNPIWAKGQAATPTAGSERQRLSQHPTEYTLCNVSLINLIKQHYSLIDWLSFMIRYCWVVNMSWTICRFAFNTHDLLPFIIWTPSTHSLW